jgi:hypothetical protein
MGWMGTMHGENIISGCWFLLNGFRHAHRSLWEAAERVCRGGQVG